MRSALLALLAFYLYTANTALVPSNPNAVTLPFRLSSTPSHHNFSTSTLALNSSRSTFERINYLIPSTHSGQSQTFISVLLHTTHPLPAMEVEIVLSAIEQQLTNHISAHGDGPLSVADDPYEFGIPGCFCSTSSARDDALTYGVLRDTMGGLQHVMVAGGRFFLAYYDIFEGETGRRLGEGNVGAEPLADTS